MSTSIQYIDSIIHSERIDDGKKKVMWSCAPQRLVEGTFVMINSEAYLFSHNKFHRWTAMGYENGIDLPGASTVTVLTPASVVNAFRAGYVPQISRAL
jgi:hypothetical protein